MTALLHEYDTMGEQAGQHAPPERIQGNVLARGERRLLNWLCARAPAWVTPDRMTALGMVGAAMVLGGYAGSLTSREWLWLSVAGYAVNWLGDSLDGSLARARKIERPNYGYFIDHSCDALATLMIVGGLGLTPHIGMIAALMAVIAYLLLSIHTFLAAKVMGEFRLSYAGAGPTELRLLLIGLTLAMYWQGAKPGHFAPWSGFDLFVGGAAVVLTVLFIVQTAITARKLQFAGR